MSLLVTFNQAIENVIKNNQKARHNPKALAQSDGYKRPLVGSLSANLKLALNNTRKAFFEWQQFSSVLKNLHEELQPAVETAYITGWRIHDEIFTHQKHHPDVKGRGWLRLDPGETKNGEGRNFPFTGHLRQIIEQQLERTKALEKATGRIIPWLFHREGRSNKSFRHSWLTGMREGGTWNGDWVSEWKARQANRQQDST